MKKILFPFEIGCPCYREAYVYAIKLARNLGAELILLNAFEIKADDSITKKQYDLLIKSKWIRAYKEIILFHDYYLSDHARIDSELRIKTDHRIIHGKLLDEFHNVLQEESIDLVVMPVQGENEITLRNLKQMRREVLAAERTSLMVTPVDKAYVPMSDIMFAFGMKRFRKIAPYLNELSLYARYTDSILHFTHLEKRTDPEHVLTEELRSSISEEHQLNKIKFHEIFGKDIKERLLQMITKAGIRLLVLPGPSLQAVDELFHTKFFFEVCVGSRIPVLILREPA